jgi:hypothetical protein
MAMTAHGVSEGAGRRSQRRRRTAGPLTSRFHRHRGGDEKRRHNVIDAENVVKASRTNGCNGYAIVTAIDGYVEVKVRGVEFGGPLDDGDSTPNSGTVVGFTLHEAFTLSKALYNAARSGRTSGAARP